MKSFEIIYEALLLIDAFLEKFINIFVAYGVAAGMVGEDIGKKLGYENRPYMMQLCILTAMAVIITVTFYVARWAYRLACEAKAANLLGIAVIGVIFVMALIAYFVVCLTASRSKMEKKMFRVCRKLFLHIHSLHKEIKSVPITLF